MEPSNDAAFLDAIRSDPHNDAIHLVYADWLDERADARGEFLRLQMDLAACAVPDDRFRSLQVRLRDLRAGIEANWLEQIGHQWTEMQVSSTYQPIINRYPRVVIRFWAPWSGPCRAMNDVMNEVASQLEGWIVVGRINIDNELRLARDNGIASIPTMMAFADGRLKEHWLGARSIDQMLAEIGAAFRR